MTWVYLGGATVGFFLGAAVYNMQPMLILGELAAYVLLAGASLCLFASIFRLHMLLEAPTPNLLRAEGVGQAGAVISTLGFTLLTYSNGGDEGAVVALAGFYFLAYWMIAVNNHASQHGPWPKAISIAGMLAAFPLVLTAYGFHAGEDAIMTIGAVLSMGLMPLWLGGLTAWLVFHDMRSRAMSTIDRGNETSS